MPMQPLNVAPIFIFLKRYPTGWHLAKKKKKTTMKRGKKNPSIDQSLRKPICKSPPPFYCPS